MIVLGPLYTRELHPPVRPHLQSLEDKVRERTPTGSHSRKVRSLKAIENTLKPCSNLVAEFASSLSRRRGSPYCNFKPATIFLQSSRVVAGIAQCFTRASFLILLPRTCGIARSCVHVEVIERSRRYTVVLDREGARLRQLLT